MNSYKILGAFQVEGVYKRLHSREDYENDGRAALKQVFLLNYLCNNAVRD